MKQKLILIIFIVCSALLFPFNGFADDTEEPGVFTFDPYLVNHLPGGYFPYFVIENYVPDATFLTEESNGFSMLDNPRVYFEGDSFVQFNWYYNGFNINSSLDDGSPAVLLPFSAVSAYRMQGETPVNGTHGMNFLTGVPSRSFSRVMASGIYTNLGGYLGTFAIQPSHPTERADRLYNERRKLLNNFFIDYQFARRMGDSHLLFSVNYFDVKRQFNDFNAFDTFFEEDGRLLLMNARYRKKISGGHLDLFGIYNRRERGNQGAEIAGYPQETADKKHNSVMAGLNYTKKWLDLKFSFLHESQDLAPHEENFSKDLMDTDGDGFYRMEKQGAFSAATFNLALDVPLRTPSEGSPYSLNLFAEARHSQIKGEETAHDFNALYFDNEPYLVVLRQAGDTYKNTNTDARAGARATMDLSDNISLLGSAFLQYNRLGFEDSDNGLAFSGFGFDVGVHLFKHKRTQMLLSYGRLPYDLRENVNFFLEQKRPHGAYYRWGDGNGDGVYQPGEEGSVFGYTGGRHHYVDENIAAPLKERLQLHLKHRLSGTFTLNIKGLYKKIKNNLRVEYDREYGFYEPYDGHDIHFYDRPFGDYYLTNSTLEKDPFYAQFLFNIEGGQKNKWFFSFSFLAHMGMGDTAFGNGPGSNDIGILSENQADPNSRINGFGRLDGDRGFVAKSYFGFRLTKKLFMGISLKYRDGDPFAFINTLSRHDQRVLYYATIKAEDSKGVKGGPREDYIADVSVRFNYSFNLLGKPAVLSLSFFNLLDFGGELSEYVFSGGTRDAVELQIPRSLRLTLNWKL